MMDDRSVLEYVIYNILRKNTFPLRFIPIVIQSCFHHQASHDIAAQCCIKRNFVVWMIFSYISFCQPTASTDLRSKLKKSFSTSLLFGT